jgi:hypothetical protein
MRAGLKMVVACCVDSKTLAQGSATTVFAAVHPDAAKMATTHYLVDSQEHKTSEFATPELAKRLWDETEKILQKLKVQ